MSYGQCPLTPLESFLQRAGNSPGYSGEFIEQYALPLIYPDPTDSGNSGRTRQRRVARERRDLHERLATGTGSTLRLIVTASNCANVSDAMAAVRADRGAKAVRHVSLTL
ncbi:MAG: hypothetical protein HKN13_09045 [Rhodothermales bacterium]|nr:hypothetical protein [Rhodothermales bacterium]